ncbi:MAG: methylmalonyl Co-A mutase-associated GTPase MeaB [Anaerolineae bacterium]
MPPILASIRSSRRELARLLTQVENGTAREALSALYPYTGNAHLIGVTGAPGTGKSSLVAAMALAYRKRGLTVGILAVDPTSPFTGGAVLGDRIRMRELSGDQGVFIRSMATRGSLGGLARATGDMIRVLDAGGFDVVLVETVGAGQSEIDIAKTAHTTLVVEAPGLGDDVQAIKAGILEIADILVVNKADHDGVENTVRALRAMLDLGHRTERVLHHGQLMVVPDVVVTEDKAWQTPIVQTVATTHTGIEAVLDKIAEHRTYLRESRALEAREKTRIEVEIIERLRDLLIDRIVNAVGPTQISEVFASVLRREIDPLSAAQQLFDTIKSSSW